MLPNVVCGVVMVFQYFFCPCDAMDPHYLFILKLILFAPFLPLPLPPIVPVRQILVSTTR